ncbi:hypothetical protein DFW101_3731 (plasmid) [Solidesulfovibrio carbinoliphilus subsp. oakridgensis]|uniref:Uncharacterized protein n=1 Tax=Solidesulfovibrio carbinoliphilus subsp. oakridgensis TaxID=694327 RepID=G7QEC1_9BACT|nr:hypothetical protein [Solidesulfovibrio carbinoliphilus]EHJ46015.1 hypothetical protein DFW101_3731 [Solidesulfovibrio carbinoliphilus subsp. oakridgensis]
MRRLHILFLSVGLLVAAMTPPGALAADIVGQYTLDGANPGGQGRYAGTALVQKKGDTYVVGWKIGNQELAGTGILEGNSFAVVYIPRDAKGAPGLVLYTLLPGGMLTGKFTNLGGTTLGTETWTPASK